MKVFKPSCCPRWAVAPLAALSLLVAALGCNSQRGGLRPLALSTATPATVPAATTAPADVVTPIEEMRQSLTYLSSDELEGRGINTGGINLAAAYIAGNFHASGLLPLPGMSDYFQRFDLTTADGIAPETSLAVDGKPLKLNEDYSVLSFSAEKSFSGPVVFVGYGITSAEHHYDDYAGVDVKGKVVLAWRYEPVGKNGKTLFGKGDEWSDLAHLDTKAKNAKDHGAVALILANPPSSKNGDSLLPFAHSYQESSAALPVLHVKRKVVDGWLQSAIGQDARSLEAKIDAKPSPASQELKDVAVEGKVALKRTTRSLRNVVGYLPGAGPHADEYVIVGAHYDHLGRGGPGSLAINSHAIHHGADDNGSGTASVMEMARELGDAYAHGKRWPRSIIFMTFTAEEEGLIGSSHFVNHPPIPLKKVVAMLNLDMVGRLRDEKLYVGGMGTAPSFEHLVDDADSGLKLEIKDSGKGGLGPSDHMSFAIKKVPVIFLFTGLHKDYHRPTDTVDKINFDGMLQVVDLSKRLIDEMTRMPKEQYVNSADAHSMMMGLGSGSGPGTGRERRATLGVIPTYGEDEQSVKGVKISGTTDGSPAAKAGLKENDVLVGWNGKALDNLMDLSTALAESKPGDKIKVKLLRDGKPIEIEATLAERK
jgi:hypothetical protein